jgi:hypothetical protein
MNYRIPTEAELAAWGVTPGEVPAPQAEPPPDQALVVGTLEFDESLSGWTGSWRMRWRDVDYARQISGVSSTRRFATSSAASSVPPPAMAARHVPERQARRRLSQEFLRRSARR